MSRSARLLVFAVVAIAAAWLVVPRVLAFLAVDSCLDYGGRYDYERRRCDRGAREAPGRDTTRLPERG